MCIIGQHAGMNAVAQVKGRFEHSIQRRQLRFCSYTELIIRFRRSDECLYYSRVFLMNAPMIPFRRMSDECTNDIVRRMSDDSIGHRTQNTIFEKLHWILFCHLCMAHCVLHYNFF